MLLKVVIKVILNNKLNMLLSTEVGRVSLKNVVGNYNCIKKVPNQSYEK